MGRIINSLPAIQTNVNEINEDEELFYQSVSHGLKTLNNGNTKLRTAYQDGIYGDEAIIIMHESVVLEAGIKSCSTFPRLTTCLARRTSLWRWT